MDMDMQQLVMEADYLPPASEATISTACGPRAVARLIPYALDSYLALPPHTTLEIVEHPVIVAVPGAVYYAYGLLVWQNHTIPVINVDTLLRAYQDTPQVTTPRYALVVAYQRAPNRPLEYGALGLAALPETIEVGDEAWCDLPVSSDLWPLLALSCLRHDHHSVPILDTAKLFASFHG